MLLGQVLSSAVKSLFRSLRSEVAPVSAICLAIEARQCQHAVALALKLAMTEADWVQVANFASNYENPLCEHLILKGLQACHGNVTILMAYGNWLMSKRPLDAAACFLEARRLSPGSLAVELGLGDIHLALGNIQSATDCFHAAVVCDESSAVAWERLGHAYGLQDKWHLAALAYGRAAFLSRECAAFQDRRNHALQMAEISCAGVVNADPNVGAGWDEWVNQASAMEKAGQAEDAETLLRRAVIRFPDIARLRLALGRLLAKQYRWQAALSEFSAGRLLDPTDSELLYEFIVALGATGKAQKAYALSQESLLSHPQSPRFLALAADCAGVVGDNEHAAQLYQSALVAMTDRDPIVLNNYGCTLTLIEKFPESVAPLVEALSLDPTLAKARLNLAYAFTYLGRRTEALALLEETLSAYPHDFESRWYRSHLLLAAGRYQEGWVDYAYRFVTASTPARFTPLPRWQGESLAGKRILVIGEQGIGDEIMFASCLPDLAALEGNVILECSERLRGLFARSFPQISVVSPGNDISGTQSYIETADCHVPAGSLPSFFRPSTEAFKCPSPFLVADPKKVEQYRQRITQLGPGLKVGIAWRGGSPVSRHRSRTTRLADWQPILDTPACHFISLQYGNCQDEIDEMDDRGTAIHYWAEAISDLDAFAALIDALDLVITVCSAPVHFAGGLGRSAWVLTPYAAEWRYSEHFGHMAWYSSVQLIRQSAPGDWQGVIALAADRLKNLADHQHRKSM